MKSLRLYRTATFASGFVVLVISISILLHTIKSRPQLNLTFDESRITFQQALKRHKIDASKLVRMMNRDEFDSRRKVFIDHTAGLLDSEIFRANLFGFCKNPVNVIADKELGYNIETFLGYAYFAHVYGCLNSTSGYPGSESFFFWSPNHHIIPQGEPGTHIWQFDNLPDDNPHKMAFMRMSEADRNKTFNPVRAKEWPRFGLRWPPFDVFYDTGAFEEMKKPIAIVAGKYSSEWGGKVLNQFAEPHELRPILNDLLDAGYLVIYNRPTQTIGADADQDTQDDGVGDHAMIRNEYSGKDVIIFQDMKEALARFGSMGSETLDHNSLMLSVYAEAKLFVCTQGGNAVIASLFPGTMHVLHIAGSEVIDHNDPPVPPSTAYERWIMHGGSRIYVSVYRDDFLRNLRAFLFERRAASRLQYTTV